MNQQKTIDREALLDLIAVHVHETWARNRATEGWSFGSKRNDDLKQHPCLVPYDQLSEEEQNYDKATANTVINALLAEGFKIVKADGAELVPEVDASKSD